MVPNTSCWKSSVKTRYRLRLQELFRHNKEISSLKREIVIAAINEVDKDYISNDFSSFAKQRFSPASGVGNGDVHVDWISAQKDKRIAKMPMGITYARQSLMGSHIC